MRESLRDYIYHLSSGTIAHLIGSPKYIDIDRAFNAAIEYIEEKGIADSYDWDLTLVGKIFKEVA